MDISIRGNNYINFTLRREAAGLSGGSGEAGTAQPSAQSGDRVSISAEGRGLSRILSGQEEEAVTIQEDDYGKQESRLMRHLAGKEQRDDNRIAYGSGEGSEIAGESTDEDIDGKIRQLQEQLRAAIKRLQEARQELSEAQAEAVSEVKAMQEGADPNALLNAETQQADQKRSAAQQKMATAQAEVNATQEQLQKYLREKAESAAKNASGSVGGGSWEPQGTNNYISGNW